MNPARFRSNPVPTCGLLFMIAAIAVAAEPAGTKAALAPEKQRKPGPEFALSNESGKTVTLKDYRGKVLLLDFWATWCHGCKEEIPWFSEMEKTYAGKGFEAVGVSLDGDGWKVLTPFLAQAKIPYEIVLGDDATAQRYGIETMPDTFLIDTKGRVAAAYRGGVVDRANIEANIKTLLSQR